MKTPTMKTVTVTSKVLFNFFLNAAAQSLAGTLVVEMKWRDRLVMAGVAGLIGVVNYTTSPPRGNKNNEGS